MNNRTIAQLGIENVQNEVQTTRTKQNFYYSNGVLYSYGKHYPLLWKVKSWNKEFIVCNVAWYSNTTSRHIGLVERACDITVELPRFCYGGMSSIGNMHDINYIKSLIGAKIKSLVQEKAENCKRPGTQKEQQYNNSIAQQKLYREKVNNIQLAFA